MNRKTKIGLRVGLGNFILAVFLMVIFNMLLAFIPSLEIIQDPCAILSFIVTLPLMPFLLSHIPTGDNFFITLLIYTLAALLNSTIWGLVVALFTKNKK